MESLDAEFSGFPIHGLCGAKHSLLECCPSDAPRVLEAYEALSLKNEADRKAEEAKAALPELTQVEKFVAHATHTNFGLFEDSFKQAINEIQAVFDERWIPAGDAAVMMQRLDNAKNFMALSQVYFQTLASPVMQACHLHMMNQQIVEANTPREPSAEERMLQGDALVGRHVIMTTACGAVGRVGTVLQYDSEDGEYEIRLDYDIDPSWHQRHCIGFVE